MLNGKDTWKGTSLSPGPLNLGLTKCQAALLGDWLLYTGIPKTMFCLRAEQGTRDGAALSTSASGTWLCLAARKHCSHRFNVLAPGLSHL